uniref:IST1 homolog n=1 Tax=Ananas comosus var. bracteatus TaxID=296719 RepID=A0A6V7NXQ8_ANACO|nr:unnamed protein product [Ananas comosus var. bracteatus]
MSALNALFNRATFGTRCKTCLNLAISRIKLLRNKREVQLINMRKEIFQYLQTGQEAIARIRVEHVIREQNILAAYEIIELFCEFILARVPILETQSKDCPLELQEAIASVIFASPRCSDLPELMQLRNLFGAKYGKEFVSVASELRPDSSVNRLIIEKLTVRAPPPDLKLKILKAIAHEYNLNWDDSNTEAEFNKKYEDLLDGSQPLSRREYLVESSSIILLPKDGSSVSPPAEGNTNQLLQPLVPPTKSHSVETGHISPTRTDGVIVNNSQAGPPADEKSRMRRNASDVLEKARAAIAAAERACAAARAAADLVREKSPCAATSDAHIGI